VPTDKRQRQKQYEQAKRAAAKKAASRKELFKRVRTALILGLVVVLLLVFINYLSGRGSELPTAYVAFRAQPVACGATKPPEESTTKFDAPADQNVSGPVDAVVKTSCGSFTMRLDPSTAPDSVNSFVFLARQGAYAGTVFSLVDANQWIQGGDLLGGRAESFYMRSGRISWRVPDEFPDASFKMSRGVVGLVGDRSEPRVGFFVVTQDKPELSNRFNILGAVTDGLDVIDKIARLPTKPAPGASARTQPTETVYIESVEIK
jgi:cyclophilin family peptidyl-prolyl cis-trans isomerase